MTTALIGHSGFVGETLKRQTSFDALYRSSDIEAISGKALDLVICAGVPAAKWKANLDPRGDRENLERLMGVLASTVVKRFILISTVDVYSWPIEVDEDSPIDPDSNNAYGKNRHALEQFCRRRFDATVIRLPALFGEGLRKNAIYDLLHDNQVDRLQPLSVFQFYDMALLWSDIQRITSAHAPVVNLATEPLSLGMVAKLVFGRDLSPAPNLAVTRYDFRTRYGVLWGRGDGYAYGSDETLRRLGDFVATARRPADAP